MKHGAYDFLTKPINLDRLEILLKRSLRNRDMEDENRALHEQLDAKFGLANIIGQSAAMQEVFDTVKQVAGSKATVLIEGESGTGKELIAHAIHRLSPRTKGPYVAVHCAALSTNLLESELFGHEKGAFTGATERRRGRFELADGGSLFLDEIGEIDASIQVKILRVLEERTFERVGGQETIETDARLIAATNRDLRAMMERGTFREDLFYRLFVVVIRVPPLRERREDIPLLIQHFLQNIAKENGRQIESITPDALQAMTAYAWPGNVRELRNAVERMVVLSRGNRITMRELPAEIRDDAPPPRPARPGAAGEPSPLSIDEAERNLVIKALKTTGGNKTRAAEQLGISRRTLHRKLHEYNLTGNDEGKRDAP
jgi:DNA-binding NtrC family response regulator